MKNILYITLISFLLFSCGNNEPIAPKNTAPTTPTLVSPTNNKLCINNSVSFEWDFSIDAEKNPIIYQLQVSTDNQFSQNVNTIETTSNFQNIDLEKGKAYYWRVKATDNKNASSNYSSINNFYTEALALSNHLPFLPQIINPDNNSTIFSSDVTLRWSASDVDAADVLSYDLYLGTDNPPTLKVGNAISADYLYISSLQYSRIYYWRIIAKDNKGAETIGQVWNFKTN